MSEATVPAAVTPGVTTVPPATPVVPAPAAPTAGVSPEVIAQMQQNIADLTKQVSFAVTKLTKSAPAKPEPKDDPTLTERIKAIEARENAQREVTRFNAIKAAAMGRGVAENRAKQLTKIVLSEMGEKVVVTDAFDVIVRESDEKSVPAADWVSAYLQTADGEIFLPIKPAATTDGARGGSATTSVPETATYTELMKQENATKLSEFMTKYPQKWQQIKAEAQAKMREGKQ